MEPVAVKVPVAGSNSSAVLVMVTPSVPAGDEHFAVAQQGGGMELALSLGNLNRMDPSLSLGPSRKLLRSLAPLGRAPHRQVGGPSAAQTPALDVGHVGT